MRYYVYQHRRNDTNEIFYIGLGTKSKKDEQYKTYRRAFSKLNRNQHWKNIVNKYNFSVDILFEFSSYEDAKNKEIELIKFYGRRDINVDGILVNMTDGGDGVQNLIFSEETKRKIGERSKGNKHWFGKTHSDDSKKKMSDSRKKFLTTEQGISIQKKLHEDNKLRTPRKGWSHTKEAKEKNKIAHQKKCVQKTLEGEIVKTYIEINGVINDGFNPDMVIACCKGRKKHYKNYIWEYENTSNTDIIK